MAVNKMKFGLIIGILMLSLFMTGCNNNTSQYNVTGNTIVSTSADEKVINIDKLEIYHFHGTNQCYSCITLGNYAAETINTYFKEELEKGKIVFDHINVELIENDCY